MKDLRGVFVSEVSSASWVWALGVEGFAGGFGS